MSVEQVVDAYLQMAQHVLGNPTTGPVSPTPAAAVAELPHPDWTGNAAQAAVTAGTALTQARSRLHSAAADVSAAIAVGTQITHEANLQLQGIINDWGAEKASAATTPAPLRDSALLQSGQLHIAEAMGLISATAERFTAAAAGVRSSTADLPNNPPAAPVTADATGEDTAGADTPHSGTADTPELAPAEPDAPLGGGAASPLSAAAAPAADPGWNTAAMPAAMMPAMMAPQSPMASPMAAPMSAPMGAMMPGLASQLLNPTPNTTTPTDPPGDRYRRRSTPVSVDAAIEAALDALGITDPAARARWHTGYDALIARESAGNPHAVNRTDSNARGPIQADGAPAGSSRGLTQLIPENFERYRLPGLPNDIYDPVANIAASMRYVMDRHHVDPSALNLTANVQQANRHLPARGY